LIRGPWGDITFAGRSHGSIRGCGHLSSCPRLGEGPFYTDRRPCRCDQRLGAHARGVLLWGCVHGASHDDAGAADRDPASRILRLPRRLCRRRADSARTCRALLQLAILAAVPADVRTSLPRRRRIPTITTTTRSSRDRTRG
jgi:hypothetical protein